MRWPVSSTQPGTARAISAATSSATPLRVGFGMVSLLLLLVICRLVICRLVIVFLVITTDDLDGGHQGILLESQRGADFVEAFDELGEGRLVVEARVLPRPFAIAVQAANDLIALRVEGVLAVVGA